MVTTFYPPYHFGGDAIYVQQLSNELAKRGHDVEVIHCKDSFDFMSGGRRAGVSQDHPSVHVHRLESSLGMLSPLGTHQTGRPLLKAARLREILEQRFDVIHYHNVSLVGGPDVLRYGQAVKLYTLHEYWLVCPTHMLFKYNTGPCLERQCFRCTVFHKRPPQWWRYTDLIEESVKHVDLFLAPSSFIAQKHQQLGLNIPTVELPYFSSRWETQRIEPAPMPDGPRYFVFVGRLEKLKGVQTLIPVFRRYEQAQLWVVGTGEYEAELRRMAAGSSNIQFLGHQSGDRLRMLFDGAVATIVPSLWYEVFGIVILESLARATPVIVRNIGGMSKIIEESGGGMTFDNDEQLLEAMDRLLADPHLRRRLGQQGHAAFHQRWTADVHVPLYLSLITRLLENQTRKADNATRHPIQLGQGIKVTAGTVSSEL
jgi:glycosyltransferase involved in cell wall biosynthesis